jgi:hypothetical protein
VSRVDWLTFGPVAVLAGLGVALLGLARLVQLVGEAQEDEPDALQAT